MNFDEFTQICECGRKQPVVRRSWQPEATVNGAEESRRVMAG